MEARPKLVAAVARWELFPGTIIIGSRELDRYVRVPVSSAQSVWQAMQYMQGDYSAAEIQAFLAAAGLRIDIEELCARLSNAGLLEGVKFRSDLERAALTWLNIPLSRFIPAWNWEPIFRALVVCALALSAAGLAVLGGAKLPGLVHGPPIANWKSVVLLVIAVVTSIAVHEGCHALAALSVGLKPTRLRVLGYLGVIPYVVLTIGGIYTVPVRQRIRIWIAGPIGSAVLGLMALSVAALLPAGHTLGSWLAKVGAVNLMIAVWNCCPLLPSDGYFIASALTRQANWRTRSWREIPACIRQRRFPSLLLLAYSFASLATLVFLVVRNMQRILRWTNHSWVGYAAIAVLLAMLVGKKVTLHGSSPRVRSVTPC